MQQGQGIVIPQGRAFTRTRGQTILRIARILRRKRLMTIGIGVLVFIGTASALAPWIAPYTYLQTDTANSLSSPTATHWFGSDIVGADTFSRVLYGGQVAFIVGFFTTVVSVILALAIALSSVQIGGWYDIVLQRFVDAWMSLPWLVIVLTVVAMFGPGLWTVIFILGVSRSFGFSRILRGSALRERGMTYVEAAQSIGASQARVAMRHVLPNIMPILIVLATLGFAQSILAEASLSFLGWGVPPPRPSWGSMLGGQVVTFMYQQPWLGVFPGIALTATVWAANVFGDGLRDILDPRLRGQGV